MIEIEQAEAAARAEIDAAQSVADLEQARTTHLGRRAPLVAILKGVRDLPPEDRGRVGKRANEVRIALEALVESRIEQLAAVELDARLRADALDVTLPARAMPSGTLHILTQTRRLLEDIFLGLGYEVIDAPEVESEWYNFTALNTPIGHPARSPSDTFYLEGSELAAGADDDAVILRTQTSTAQLRAMQRRRPPIYVVHPGRVYRRDHIDATHSDMFHQMEALAVDEGLTLADLKGTIEEFCSVLFGGRLEVRLRTHFFPFTEPSVEADVQCYACGGSGDVGGGRCGVCRGEGWIEIMGAGMVDPGVLGFVDGYDAPRLTGFAFGVGIDRVAMLRHGIPDLRLMLENDPRFLAQFSGRL